MRSTYEEQYGGAIEIKRAIVQGDAQLCGDSKFGSVCKALWPYKTAEQLASRVGCGVRAAQYEISGERHPSAQSLAAVIAEIVPAYK